MDLRICVSGFSFSSPSLANLIARISFSFLLSSIAVFRMTKFFLKKGDSVDALIYCVLLMRLEPAF
jgi:hypothetical protein